MINLFVNPYVDQDPLREKELKECLKHNENNPFIDRIVFVRENDRATYNDFFRATRNYPNDINIISNLDIYFDQSLEKLIEHKDLSGKYWRGIQPNECYALTRWNVSKNGRLDAKLFEEHAQWSQDVWIFKGTVNPRINAQFHLGVWGCDNHVAYLISKFYKISNPCHTIRCFHLHANEARPYKTRVGNRSTYQFVLPIKL